MRAVHKGAVSFPSLLLYCESGDRHPVRDVSNANGRRLSCLLRASPPRGAPRVCQVMSS